jgi:hypothetical protein
MKSLRIAALILALGAFSMSSLPAHAQQEVDPDHYDQSTAAPAKGSGAQSQKKITAAQHHSNANLASKHTHKTHHHASA